jgi:hypothetical protein
MIKEYIEREAIIKLSKEIKNNFAPLHRKVINAFIYNIDKNIPTADVAPVIHGEWEIRDNEYHCSACGVGNEELTNFCPYCGARMGGNLNG